MSLGYACINMTLGKQKPKITTNRSMINKTFKEKGISSNSVKFVINSHYVILFLSFITSFPSLVASVKKGFLILLR